VIVRRNHDLVTFGETMIWLSPPDFQRRLEQTSLLEVNVGSSEPNVAAAAQQLRLD